MPKQQKKTKNKKSPGKANKAKPILKEETSKYKSFKLQKKIKHESGRKITGSFRLFRDSASFFFQHWKIFLGITLVYALLSVVLVGVSEGTNVADIEEGAGVAFGENLSQLGLGVIVFTTMVGASSGASEGASAYQAILTVMASLATIWAVRQLMAGQKASVKESFYKGMFPLVPVVLVVAVIGLQLLPIAVAGFVYSVMFVTGLAANFMEQFLWVVVIFLLVLWSLYMLTSSVFAFYIATLPDMRPIQALRSARGLVAHRRWSVMRRILFLPFGLFVVGLIIMLPLIWLVPPAAPWVFFTLSMASLTFSHVYFYSLYKELL